MLNIFLLRLALACERDLRLRVVAYKRRIRLRDLVASAGKLLLVVGIEGKRVSEIGPKTMLGLKVFTGHTVAWRHFPTIKSVRLIETRRIGPLTCSVGLFGCNSLQEFLKYFCSSRSFMLFFVIFSNILSVFNSPRFSSILWKWPILPHHSSQSQWDEFKIAKFNQGVKSGSLAEFLHALILLKLLVSIDLPRIRLPIVHTVSEINVENLQLWEFLEGCK
jgi:hypothetical protein